jgi:hypothetical protein
MNLSRLCLVLVAVSLVGCGKTAPKEPAPAPAAAPVSVAPPDAPAPAPPSAETPPAADAGDALAQAPNLSPMDYSNASGLTLMVQQYADTHGRVPKDLSELVAAKMLLKVPVPPPGTKYVIDPKRKMVVVVKAP